jgi:putative acetyltransferase
MSRHTRACQSGDVHPATDRDRGGIQIRPYQDADAAATLAVFLAAVTETAADDYTPEQIRAWANPAGRDLTTWHAAMLVRGSFVAMIDGDLAGFSDVSPDGYIDMMFVAPRFLGRGVAWRMVTHSEELARTLGAPDLTADVSITARPFFERQGFTVVTTQHPVKAGVRMTNFRMRKPLH